MAHRVVCVSGTDGSLMRDVAHGVAGQLGFRIVDEEIVARAAADGGVAPEVMADAEKRRSFLERAFDAMAPGTAHSLAAATVGGFVPTDAVVGDELGGLIRTAIEETASRGNVVIVAHAASHALAAQPDALRVLVTASPSVRRERVAAERGLDDKEAARAIEHSDSARADYLKRFYGTRSEQPTQYDLVVNTDVLGVDKAAELVAAAAGL